MIRLWTYVATVIPVAVQLVQAELWTPRHEAGRCALRGTCGGGGFFSPSLPCVDNGLAKDPEDDVRQKLINLCGPKWSTGPICCEEDQVRASNVMYMPLLTASSDTIIIR